MKLLCWLCVPFKVLGERDWPLLARFQRNSFFYLTLCHPFLVGKTYIGLSGGGVVRTYFSTRGYSENLNYNSVGPNTTFCRWALPTSTFWSRKIERATFPNKKLAEKDKISTTSRILAMILWWSLNHMMKFYPPHWRKTGRQWSGINPTEKRRKRLPS